MIFQNCKSEHSVDLASVQASIHHPRLVGLHQAHRGLLLEMQVELGGQGRVVHTSAGENESRLLGRFRLHDRWTEIQHRRHLDPVHSAELQQALDLRDRVGQARTGSGPSIRRPGTIRTKLQRAGARLQQYVSLLWIFKRLTLFQRLFF